MRNVLQDLVRRELHKVRTQRAAEEIAERQTVEEAARAARTTQLERWKDDPVLFVVERCGGTPTKKQMIILRAVASQVNTRKDKKGVAVRSGHKIGKSRCIAWLALWFAECFGGRVVLTSSSAHQVKDILWYELSSIVQKIGVDGDLAIDPATGLRFRNGARIFGFSTDKPENAAGISGHAENLLYLVDEASGIAEAIFEAIQGNLAGGASIAMFSNPTRPTGTFFLAFNDPRQRQFWICIHSSSLEAAEENVPGLATRAWCEQRKAVWGEKSPLYQVRVLGNFPAGGTNNVISLSQLDDSKRRHDAASEQDELRWSMLPLEVGVDVARYGDDDSVILPRRGPRSYGATIEHGLDTMAVAKATLRAIAERARPQEIVRVKVDGAGVGAGVVDKLMSSAKKLEKHFSDWRQGLEENPPPFRLQVIEVVSGSKSDLPDKFYNLRSQLHFAVSEWLDDGGVIEPDPRLEAELLAPEYEYDDRMRKRVEGKDEVKAKLPDGRSPDVADALALSVYHGAPRYEGPGGKVVTYSSPMAGL